MRRVIKKKERKKKQHINIGMIETNFWESIKADLFARQLTVM